MSSFFHILIKDFNLFFLSLLYLYCCYNGTRMRGGMFIKHSHFILIFVCLLIVFYFLSLLPTSIFSLNSSHFHASLLLLLLSLFNDLNCFLSFALLAHSSTVWFLLRFHSFPVTTNCSYFQSHSICIVHLLSL